jgi:hypothetical protein
LSWLWQIYLPHKLSFKIHWMHLELILPLPGLLSLLFGTINLNLWKH